MELRVKTPDELIAAVPHVMGFRVEDSMVVLPLSEGLPFARVDLPANSAESAEMIDSLMGAYGRVGRGEVMLIGFADDARQVDPVSRQLRESLAEACVSVRGQLWAGEHRWTDLESGYGGPRTSEASGRIDAEMVLGGRRMPAPSRKAIEQGFVGDPEPVIRELPAVANAMESSTPARDRQWAVSRAEAFAESGRTLSTPDAARMLACLQSTKVRDQMATRISRDSAPSWAPLWEDLTRRAPDQLVAPAATLSALSSWCKGDGARAWWALDRIPVEQREAYPLAVIMASALQGALHPREWDKVRSTVLDVLPTESIEGVDRRGPRPGPPSMGEGRPPVGPAR
jgi:hypothetical protein